MQETQVWSLGWEESPGEGNDNLFHYSCLGNPMDRVAWQATAMGSQKSQMRFCDWARTGFPKTALHHCVGDPGKNHPAEPSKSVEPWEKVLYWNCWLIL